MAQSHDVLPPKTPFQALGGLVFLACSILGFFGICSVVHINNFWVGYLFMFLWFGIEEARTDRLLPAAVGAMTGLVTSYSVSFFAHYMALNHAAVAAFGLTLLIIYLRLLGRLRMFANQATMLFLTIGSIPFVHTGITMEEMFISLTAGIAYFGIIGLVTALLAHRKATHLTDL